jgi:hypothetical protein
MADRRRHTGYYRSAVCCSCRPLAALLACANIIGHAVRLATTCSSACDFSRASKMIEQEQVNYHVSFKPSYKQKGASRL